MKYTVKPVVTYRMLFTNDDAEDPQVVEVDMLADGTVSVDADAFKAMMAYMGMRHKGNIAVPTIQELPKDRPNVYYNPWGVGGNVVTVTVTA